MKIQKNELIWINIAKFIAIIAVLVDHTRGVMYTNPIIQLCSFYSVPLFILIAGLTSYLSNEKLSNDISWYKVFWKSSKK